MRLELTRAGLLVELANHYTTHGLLTKSTIAAQKRGSLKKVPSHTKKLKTYLEIFVVEIHLLILKELKIWISFSSFSGSALP